MNALVQVGQLDRTTYIGGSDAAAILGVSKWRTPLDVYLIKTGEEQDEISPEKQKIFRRGKRLEPIAIEMLVDEYGFKVTRTSPEEDPNRYQDPEYPFMAAEIDFEFEVTAELLDVLPEGFIDPALLGTIQNGEIKTVHPLAAHMWGEEFTEDVPIDYAAQSMHGLMVTGRKVCVYGTLVGADNLVIYKIERDEETIAGLRKKEIAFWQNLTDRLPPDPVNLEDIKTLFARIRGKAAQIGAETVQDLLELKRLRESAKLIEERKDEVEFRLAMAVRAAWGASPEAELEDDARLIHDDLVVGTWKKQSRATVDGKKLREIAPAAYQECLKESHFRMFRLSKDL